MKGQSLNELYDPNLLGKYVATKNVEGESIDFKTLVNQYQNVQPINKNQF